jgi:small subunit ribosomal protein S17
MIILSGKVISKKMEKTATVVVERVVIHPLYKKRFRRSKKYHVHDTFGVEVGQTVKFVASKPFSRSKRWKIIEVVDGKKQGVKKSKTKKVQKETKGTKKVKEAKKQE